MIYPTNKILRQVTEAARKAERLDALNRTLRLRRYLTGLRERTHDRSWHVVKGAYYADASGGGRRGGNWRAVIENKAGRRRRLWYAYFQYWRVA